MAIIGKIRKRSGLLIAIVGIALASFVLGDFLKKSNRNNMENVGEIAGEKVTYAEFESKAEEYLQQITEQNKNLELTAENLYEIKMETWKNLVKEILLNKELDALGITVTTDELFDLVQGKNPHYYILQSFSDPQTGAFNPQVVMNFLQTLDQREPEVKKQWLNLEKAIKEERISTKYLTLIRSAYFVPKAFAMRDYVDKNKSADIEYILLPYKTIPDETIKPTEDDIKKAYEEHKHEFNVKESFCDIEYVVFDVEPSKEDRAKIEEEINGIKEEFSKTEDLAYIVNANSDMRYDSTYKKQDQLPVMFDSLIFNSPIGTTLGPLVDNNNYYLARVIDFQTRPDSVKASHILIRYKGAQGAPETVTRTEDEAKAKADSIQKVLKKQAAQFGVFAMQFSEDESLKEKQGDLGWFSDGMMVPEFNEACFKGKKNDIVVVKTVFGYHVLNISDQAASVKKIKVAMIQRLLEPSSETFQKVYSEATQFIADNKTVEQFDKALIAAGRPKRIAEAIKIMDNNIPGLKSPREIIRWAFNEETEKDQISKVFDVDSKYVIAVLKLRQPKGIPTLDVIKDKITPLAIRNKKIDMLTEKIKGVQTAASTLELLSQKLNTPIEKAEMIKFSSFNLPAIGPEPDVIGTAFALGKGVISKPIAGGNGVFIVKVNAFYEAPAITDYTPTVKMLQNFFMQRASYEVFKALEDVYEVTDNRHLFY